jgi:hypothetical protein
MTRCWYSPDEAEVEKGDASVLPRFVQTPPPVFTSVLWTKYWVAPEEAGHTTEYEPDDPNSGFVKIELAVAGVGPDIVFSVTPK